MKIRLKAPRDLDEWASVVAGKRPSSTSGFTVYADLAGNLILRIRSHRQYGENTDLRRMAQEWLFWVLLMWALLDAYFKRQFQSMSRGLWLMPRDIFIAVLTGKLFSFEVDGFTYYPVRAIMAVSDSLDAISQIPGALLYRALDRWRGLLPGATGAYLRLDSDGKPYWDDQPEISTADTLVIAGGGELTGPSQGSSTLTIGGGRLGIVLPNLTIHGVSMTAKVPSGTWSVKVSYYLYSYSTAGGDLFMSLEGGLFNSNGQLALPVYKEHVVAQPASGANGVFSFPSFSVATSGSGWTLHLRVIRQGGHVLDTSSSPVALWQIACEFTNA